MIEHSYCPVGEEDGATDAQITAFEAASYIFQLCREMAGMADSQGLMRLAAALELARDLAGETLATQPHSSPENAAPEDAA